jgi:1,4-dihydroxy-2-naphthoate octaprenyltransferase
MALASGLLMFNVHLLNEFPDVEADITGNRKNLPIILSRKKASWFYLASTVAFYIWMLTWTIAGVIPLLTLLSIVTLPIAIWVTKNTFNYREQTSFVPTLWAGAIIYFLTMVLLALGYIIDGLSLSV